MPKRAAKLLDFWFHSEKYDIGSGFSWWFSSSREIDELIRQHFEQLAHDAKSGSLKTWEGSQQSGLALIIALDQLPRNLYRNSAEAFACDPAARRVSRDFVKTGFVDELSEPAERMFSLLPYMHSESMHDQDESVGLFSKYLPAGHPAIDHAISHRETVERFGRFPVS